MTIDKSAAEFYRSLKSTERGAAVRYFLLHAVEKNPRTVAALTARFFQISRQAVNYHLDRLVADGSLTVNGETKGRTYALKTLVSEERTLAVSPDLHEDEVWTREFVPHLTGLPDNVQRICYHGFTEMLNNVIDHSESANTMLIMKATALKLSLHVYDYGVGIFNKIQKARNLETVRVAMFELTKGKLTTDPDRHTGEGIFFTSRMFDSFSILSGGLFLTHERGKRDWLVDDGQHTTGGTSVSMDIDPRSPHTTEEILLHYATEQDDYAFNRTTIVIKLLLSEGEMLISRSQAKRVAERLDKFKEVVLSFDGITSIGPAFADELFRVFKKRHPHVSLIPINANEEVTRMIQRAESATALL